VGADLDTCTDLPLCCLWRAGGLVDEPTDISGRWRSDLVGFVGCSFSFEEALMEQDIELHHIERGCNVAIVRGDLGRDPRVALTCGATMALVGLVMAATDVAPWLPRLVMN
jgi:uncharacterized protein YcsI (UPF0317 family)